MHPTGMPGDGVMYPPVFVVDGQAGYPLPATPRPRPRGAAQWPLYLLLSLALCGLAVEACFIYHLYSSISPPVSTIAPPLPVFLSIHRYVFILLFIYFYGLAVC